MRQWSAPAIRLSITVVVLLAFCGCVRRRLFVNSNPPGALVYVDNEQIGTTPCAVDFTYYGTREIRLVKSGYETLTVNQPIPTPWYEFPPLDFISENLVPYKIRDNRSVSFNLAPQVIVPPEQLIARGNQLRQETLQGLVVPTTSEGPPIPAATPIPVTPLQPIPGTAPAPGLPAVVLPPPPAPLQPVITPEPIQLGPPATPTPVLPQRGQPIVSPPLR